MTPRATPTSPAVPFHADDPVHWYRPVTKKRNAVVVSTAAAANLPAKAPSAGTSMAMPATKRNRPSALLVAPGGDDRMTTPTVSHVPHRMPIPVPATESRAKYPKTDDR